MEGLLCNNVTVSFDDLILKITHLLEGYYL
jgi:hypothetical protein